jgi:hypothetical protein
VGEREDNNKIVALLVSLALLDEAQFTFERTLRK